MSERERAERVARKKSERERERKKGKGVRERGRCIH